MGLLTELACERCEHLHSLVGVGSHPDPRRRHLGPPAPAECRLDVEALPSDPTAAPREGLSGVQGWPCPAVLSPERPATVSLPPASGGLLLGCRLPEGPSTHSCARAKLAVTHGLSISSNKETEVESKVCSQRGVRVSRDTQGRTHTHQGLQTRTDRRAPWAPVCPCSGHSVLSRVPRQEPWDEHKFNFVPSFLLLSNQLNACITEPQRKEGGNGPPTRLLLGL